MSYPVTMDVVNVGFTYCESYVTGVPSDTYASVWRPNVDGQFPVISFSHGLYQGGDNIMINDVMLTALASTGYIIIAHRAAWSFYCYD